MSENKYNVEIKQPNWEGYKYAVFYSKRYGNMSGGATEFKTKEDLIGFIKKQFKRWEKYDSIVQRIGDKVTKNNLEFTSFTDDITKAELFGIKTLFSFG